MASTRDPLRPAPTVAQPTDDVSAGAEGIGESEALSRRFLNRRTLLSFVVAAELLVFFVTRLDLDFETVGSHLRGVNVGLLGLGIVAYFSTFPLRALRWRLLLSNIGLVQSGGKMPSIWGLAEIILIGWFVNCVVPAKLGDAYRAYLLKKNAQVSFSSTAGTVVAERLIDMLVLFGLLCLAAVRFIGGANQDKAQLVVALGFGLFLAILTGIGGMWLFGRRLNAYLPSRLQPMYLRFQEGTLGSFRQLPALIAITVVIWLLETSRLYLVAQSLAIPLEFSFVLFAALANSLLTVVPFTPGGLGLVENGAAELFRWAGLPAELAFSLILLDRGISYWGVVGTGLVVFVLSKKK